MSKKIIALLLAASLAGASLAACGGNNDDGKDTSADTTAGTTDNTDTTEADTTGGEEQPTLSAELTKLHTAIREAYGEEYIANMPVDAEALNNLYGVKPEWVSEFVAEMPMMSANVDTLIIVKPSAGNSENVLNALKAHYDYLVNESSQYPMNIEKVRAAQVFAKGDYVFFFMLGLIPDSLIYPEIGENMTDDEIAKLEADAVKAQYDAAVANNQKAIDAIDSVLGK